MSTKNEKNGESEQGYDIKRDLCVAPALILHIDEATGIEMSGFGEGVASFGVVARSMVNTDGVAGQTRIAIVGAFVAKESTRERQSRWIVGPKGKCSLGVPTTGAVCLGSATKRLAPMVAATLYSKCAAYAVKVSAALSASRKAA
jgi:hypothetical protein